MSQSNYNTGTIILVGTGDDATDTMLTAADAWAFDLINKLPEETSDDLELIAKLASISGEIEALMQVMPSDVQAQFLLLKQTIIEARFGVGVRYGPAGAQ